MDKMPTPCIHQECLNLKADLMLEVSVKLVKGGVRSQQSHVLTLAGSAFLLLSSAVKMADTDCKRKAVQDMSTLIHDDLLGAMTPATMVIMALSTGPLFNGKGRDH